MNSQSRHLNERLAKQAGPSTPRSYTVEPVTLSEHITQAEGCNVCTRIHPFRPLSVSGIHLSATKRTAMLVNVRIAGVSYIQGGGVPASLFGHQPLGISVETLTCSMCGAPLGWDETKPITICEFCRAASVVCMPTDVPPEFARTFARGLDTLTPAVGIEFETIDVATITVWGEGVRC